MKAAGVTQKQIARDLGKSQSTISEILNPDSNPTLETLWTLADYFKVDISEVIKHYNRPSRKNGGEQN